MFAHVRVKFMVWDTNYSNIQSSKMRLSVWLVIVFLLVGVFVLTYIPFLTRAFQSTIPPGQYPMDAARWKWPVSIRTKEYAPARSMGSDSAEGLSSDSAKVVCATQTACDAAYL